MKITDEMLERATDAVIADLRQNQSHGCRIRWGTSPDNFNFDGHVDLRSIARAALTAALEPVRDPYKLNTTQEKT